MEILSSNQEILCQDGDEILLDSMQYRRQYYTSLACGDRLRLYQLKSSSLEPLDDKCKIPFFFSLKQDSNFYLFLYNYSFERSCHFRESLQTI